MAVRSIPQRVVLAGFVGLATVAAGGVAIAAQAADAGCSVNYQVDFQWPGGFTSSVAVTNLGHVVDSWSLTWSFAGGQKVTEAWNANVTQNASEVSAANAGYNRVLAADATVTFGFNASAGASNPAPSSFALNGVTCTGAISSVPPTTIQPSAPVSSAPGPTDPPTSAPTPTSPPAAPSSPTAAPTPSVSVAATPTTPPAAYPNPGAVSGATGTHDPSVVKTPGGTYIVAQTGNNIPLTTSTDRTAFKAAGAAFPSGAPWTTAYTGGSASLWAPDISYHNGQYYMYYSASTFGSNHSAIFLATSATGASGSWTNQGLVIESVTSNNYNAIDPNLIVDDAGQWWLNFGSFWSGIQQIKLNPSTGLRADTSIKLIAGRGGGAIEAAYMFKHGSYYYLWVSFDLCCKGASSTYRIMVGRSTSANGPFVDRNGTAMASGGGTQVLAGHGSIHGPGHEAVFADTDAEVLAYHYYADSGASFLGLNLLGYDTDGWPFVY